jgi:hypothetical protein
MAVFAGAHVARKLATLVLVLRVYLVTTVRLTAMNARHFLACTEEHVVRVVKCLNAYAQMDLLDLAARKEGQSHRLQIQLFQTAAAARATRALDAVLMSTNVNPSPACITQIAKIVTIHTYVRAQTDGVAQIVLT